MMGYDGRMISPVVSHAFLGMTRAAIKNPAVFRNTKYIIKKLWLLILLLIISAASVMIKTEGSFITEFLNSYFFFALYVLGVGVAAHFFGEALPRSFDIENGFFCCHAWEDEGKIYDRLFHVKEWKDQRFDIAKAFGNVRSKKPALLRNPEEYRAVLMETCVAEVTHWFLILLSPLMLIIVKKRGRSLLLALYIIANLGDIIIQRFNRPRFLKAYQRLLRSRT